MRYPFLFLLFLLLVQVSSAWPWWSLTKPSNSGMICERGGPPPNSDNFSAPVSGALTGRRRGRGGCPVLPAPCMRLGPARGPCPPGSMPGVAVSKAGVCAGRGGAQGAALTLSLPQGMKQSYDEYADSDEDQHDAYLERMKEEGKIREENANDSSDGSGEETGEG